MGRGQAAFEFLLTYGWALLALLAVIIVLLYVSGAQQYFIPSSCTVGVPFACVDAAVTQDGIVTLGLQNAASDRSYTRVELHCNGDPLENRSYAENALLRVQGRINGSYVYFSCPIEGSRFYGPLTIEYRSRDEDVTHTVPGTLKLHVE